MKKLTMTFKTSSGKQASIKPTIAKEDLTAETVKKAMDDISALNIFAKDNVALYQEPKSAHYTETIITDIF
ncbi:DUF2922 domain-containing protein [Vagococcus vulneris]|uniref:DUF2922 domain-containing protein n=1 Tax=Vagococcus vulneris TaxID=1977869 RepID=A0A429ZZU7_9ENTE|nr:DUF2922 domain-containing protein [Vagococcus vulneris]RST99578.1 hypothetical protein CBF37_04420 [Vagococcus vulneris]